jgi:hypothetical protein
MHHEKENANTYVNTPVRWVQVESSEINIAQLQVCLEINTLSSAVEPIRARWPVEETLIANSDKMLAIQALDILRHLINPSGDSSRCARRGGRETSLAARLVGKLPSENSWRVGVTGDDSLDVVLVSVLDVGVGVEGIMGLAGSESIDIDSHSSVVIPVVDEWDNQFNASLLSSLDDVVETSKTGGASVDCCGTAVPDLEVGLAALGRSVVAETPNTEDSHSRLLELIKSVVNITGVLEVWSIVSWHLVDGVG